MNASDYAVPLIFAFVLIFGLVKRVDIFEEFAKGVKDGITTVAEIFPALFILVISVGMFRASGGLDIIGAALRPVTDFIGFPKEVTPLLLLRPFSGSGAVAIYENILKNTGADSFAGRVASVVLGSSETTFYTIAVYFSAAKIKKNRYVLPAAISGDIATWLLSGIIVNFWFNRTNH